ncbi:Hypothetical_protein [Hexamita inflata]|uniref:Hypothetical_protein n=1 Tax=Hexamita inflata TaxID=28002 RepID=A0AA86Q3Z4_9EUKA|nr:Hypothetical protein HINF_LOCUS37781 [Hexamita inflata]
MLIERLMNSQLIQLSNTIISIRCNLRVIHQIYIPLTQLSFILAQYRVLTFDGIKGMFLHLEEAPSEERVNARFSWALLGFALQLFLGCSYWAGRFYSLCFKISSIFSIFFRDLIVSRIFRNLIFRYEISLVKGLHNNHQVGLYLRDLHVCVVFCVDLYNIFKFAAQFFLVQFGLKLFCLISPACSSIQLNVCTSLSILMSQVRAQTVYILYNYFLTVLVIYKHLCPQSPIFIMSQILDASQNKLLYLKILIQIFGPVILQFSSMELKPKQ